MEVWKDVKGYEGFYKISNLGSVKSLKRRMPHARYGYRLVNSRILKTRTSSTGYLIVNLHKNKTQKTWQIHQLVAMSFLKHKPCGYKLVVNHKNFNKKDNRVENLEIITQRENSNLKHIQSTSKYVGVHWSKGIKKWCAAIRVNGKQKKLGFFKEEYDAHLAYQKALKEVVTNK